MFLQIIKTQRWVDYSTKLEVNPSNIKPLISYYNCELEKDRILKENRNKAVVYRWTNNVNKKTYVGSSVNF